MKLSKIFFAALTVAGFIYTFDAQSTCRICGCKGQAVSRYYINPNGIENSCMDIIRDNTSGAILSAPTNSATQFGMICSNTTCKHSIADHNYDAKNGTLCGISASEKLPSKESCENVENKGTITPAVCK